jgi:hypothetical protein
MKIINKINKLETIEERCSFFDSLWKTEEFKLMSKDSTSLVGKLKSPFCSLTRYFYNMQDKDIERAAFTSWYNVLSLKQYENEYVQDLYYLHEITHICTMPYLLNISFTQWQSKMRDNEVYSSLVSEILIYFENPSLRKKTFTFPIWADQFLNDNKYKNDYFNNFNVFYDFLIKERARAYEFPVNQVEKELSRFKEFSFHFYNTWKDRYNEVESAVFNFKQDKDDKKFDLFLDKNQSINGILFEDLVKNHYSNYINFGFSRPHY